MSETAYEKLQNFMGGLEARKLQLWGREQEITQELSTLESGLDEAIILNTHQTTQEQISTLKQELASVRRERFACTNPPRTGILLELTEALWLEATNEITGPLRAEWDKELIELERAKAMYLKAVNELGNIKARSDRITSRATEALLAVPGLKKLVPSLSTNVIIRHDLKSGVIFLDPDMVAKTFTGHRR
jgi:hypothetical protein